MQFIAVKDELSWSDRDDDERQQPERREKPVEQMTDDVMAALVPFGSEPRWPRIFPGL